jgi:protein TonB
MQTLATLVALAMTGAAFAGQTGGQAASGTAQIKPPAIIKHVPPVYPAAARAARIQGRVVVEATIGATGTVVDAKVVRSIPLLDQAALDAVKQWVYEPTIVKGKPTPVVMTVTVNFVLDAAPAQPAEPPASFDALLAAARFEEAEAVARTAAEHFDLGRRLADTAPFAGEAERTRNLARAEEHLKRAIELAPDPALRRDAMTRLDSYYTTDNPARRAAGDAFIRSLIDRYPNDPTPHLLLASALFTPQTMDRYVDALRAVAARFPRDPELRANVAAALRDTIKFKPGTTETQQRALLNEARTWADKGLQLDAENELTLLVKALILRDLAGFEKNPKRKAALEAESERLIERQKAIEARKSKGTSPLASDFALTSGARGRVTAGW